jgi:hypothetical protein
MDLFELSLLRLMLLFSILAGGLGPHGLYSVVQRCLVPYKSGLLITVTQAIV